MDKTIKKILNITFRYLLPLALLYFILSKIDFRAFPEILSNSSIGYIILFFCSNPINYLYFTIRWLLFIKISTNRKFSEINFQNLHKIVYKGLFYGYFVPGAIGVDIYRVLKTGNRYGSYEMQTGFIIIEKIVGIFAFSFMALIMYPFVKTNLPIQVVKVLDVSLIASLFIVGCIVLIFFLGRKQSIFRNILSLVKNKLEVITNAVLQKVTSKEQPQVVFNEIFAPLMNFRILLVSFCTSLFVIVTGSIFLNILFYALGANIPMVVNLFLLPVMNLLFLLPVSFGGIGLREATFVIFYGAFGVSEEVALLVAITTFIFLIMNNSFGGILAIIDNVKKSFDK